MSPLSTAELLAEVPDELVAQFRSQFLDLYKKEVESGVFDKRDVEDMLDQPRIRMYLALADHDLKMALKQTREMFVWRNEFKVRDIQLSDFPPAILNGSMFYRNKDLEGNNVFWFRVRFNKKGQLNVEKKKFFAYMLEQHYQKFRGERVTFVFDMTDTGLMQADLDVLRFEINCFQHYFPFMVNNLIVYKLPWVLEAIWKIVKTWLSAKSQEKVKFVSGEAIEPFISRDNRFIHLGNGMDRFAEMHGDGDSIFLAYSDLYSGTPRISTIHNASFASVAMSETSLAPPPSETDTLTLQGGIVASPSQSSSLNTPPASPQPAVEAVGLDVASTSTPKKPVQRSVSSNEPLLEFSPDVTIVFDKTTTSSDVIEASVYLKNLSAGVVAFKVKSTSMTRYRSRPCAGFIQPNHSRHVHISCRYADRGFLSNDRFLVQYMQVQETDIDSSIPPSSVASKLLISGEKLLEKRLIPSPAASLGPPPVITMNGNAVDGKAHATPTPPQTPSQSETGRSDATDKLLQELANQRRYLRYLTVVVTLQMLLFFVVFVFQIFPYKFRDMNSDGNLSSPDASSSPVNPDL